MREINANDPIYVKPVLNVKETAELYRVGRDKIYRWIKENPSYDWYFMNGNRLYIWSEKFKAFLMRFRNTDEIGA